MNVLSLFDGLSCGQIALERAGVKVDTYFASEVDKHAIKVTQHNYPDTIQIGSVTEIKTQNLPQIDLLIGGSPCTNFSFSGKRNGMTTKDNVEILTLEHYLQLKEEGMELVVEEKKPEEVVVENYTKTDLKDMNAKQQKAIMKELGFSPTEIKKEKKEDQRIKAIMNFQAKEE